jgi:ethanolamine utilization microcompartment shell protein EutS
MEKDPQKKANITNAVNDVENGIKDVLFPLNQFLSFLFCEMRVNVE